MKFKIGDTVLYRGASHRIILAFGPTLDENDLRLVPIDSPALDGAHIKWPLAKPDYVSVMSEDLACQQVPTFVCKGYIVREKRERFVPKAIEEEDDYDEYFYDDTVPDCYDD